jgi:hypothetical protein
MTMYVVLKMGDLRWARRATFKVCQSSTPYGEDYTNSILNSNLLVWFLPLCSPSSPYHRTSLRIATLYFIVDVLSDSISDEGSTVLKGAVETPDFWRRLLGAREERLERLEGEDCGERRWCKEECREDSLFGRSHCLIQQVRPEGISKM